MADLTVNYQGEAFSGDVLQFEVGAGEPSSCGFRLFYRVTRPADATAIALIESGMTCFDYESRSLRRLPETLAILFEQG